MKLVFKKNPAIQVTAPKIRTINTGKYGWYEVEDCVDGGYEKILAPFSMAFWDLVEKQPMKYIPADKLTSEIERRMSENIELAEMGCDTFGHRAVEDNDILSIIDSLQQEQESVAERFARIVRGNLIGIDKEVQHKFEQLYFEVTGNKMYGGYND